ncbi:MAG TPA: phosphatase PAP2 family protein [Prolixibacteraceae bacterium]|nr:phosphatase PAP2 family protein [Prolixibacteraceae bacterium]
MKFFLKFVLALGFVLPFTSIYAEKRDTSVVVKIIRHGWDDGIDYLVSPVHWDAGEWLTAAGVVSGTAALIAWGDQPVYDFANTLHAPFLDAVSPWLEPSEDIYPLIAVSGLLLHGLLTKDNYNLETALIAGESFLFTSAVTHLFKHTTSRARPYDEAITNPHQWSGPFFKGNSFFSGHTSASFSVASVLAYRYRDTGWVPVLSYGLATLCGLQRIYENRHWASDVLMGAAVGTATGLFLCRQWEKSTIRFYPVISPVETRLTLVIPIQP